MSDKQPAPIYGGKLPHYLARPVMYDGALYNDVVGASIAMGVSVKETLSALYARTLPGLHFVTSVEHSSKTEEAVPQ